MRNKQTNPSYRACPLTIVFDVNIDTLERYQTYRKKQERIHNAWLERKKLRDEKIARGEDGGPEEPDPTAEVEIGFLSLLKFIFYAVVFLALAGKFITGSYLWEYEGKWAQLKTYWPVSCFDLTVRRD